MWLLGRGLHRLPHSCFQFFPSSPRWKSTDVGEQDCSLGCAGLRDSGELWDGSLIGPMYQLVATAPTEKKVATWGGTPVGCLQGTLLWDVKATLRKRWRHKAEWRANILKDFFKKGPEITVAGMQGTAALDQSPNPTMLSLVWGNFSLYSTALCTLPSYILHAPGTQIQPGRSLGHGSSPAFGSLWSTWGSQAQK